MTRLIRWIAAALVIALPLGIAGAQQVTGTVSAGAAVGPRVQGSRVGIQVQGAVSENESRPAPIRQRALRRGVPHMIVGGAAIIVGGFVGDDTGGLISIAGLGVGLWGLYLFLQDQ